MIDLTGKTALVTGGSRGIGRAIVLRLAQQGADIAFMDRGAPETAAQTKADVEAIGRRAIFFAGDVTDPAACTAFVQAAIEAFGKVDILVNNAGITRDDLVMRMGIDEWKMVLEVNLFGAFYCTKAVLRPMLKARAGRIINMSSVSGQAGQAGQANYSSSKAGLVGLARSIARELGSRTITANVIAPGFVDTDMTQALPEARRTEIIAQVPLRRYADPSEIAAAVVFLASEGAGYITGAVLPVDGGLGMGH
jgi:3-oxoacyl-[acyl-carrier protein] reductase